MRLQGCPYVQVDCSLGRSDAGFESCTQGCPYEHVDCSLGRSDAGFESYTQVPIEYLCLSGSATDDIARVCASAHEGEGA